MTTRQRDDADGIRAQLRTSGLRVTDSRIAVLGRMRAQRAPISHADLVTQLAPDGWDRATIFRVLNDLVEAGLVHRVDVGDHVWRFERCEEDHPHEGGEHPHFVCSDCGDVVCLPDAEVTVHARGGPKALARAGLDVQLKGRCDRCA